MIVEIVIRFPTNNLYVEDLETLVKIHQAHSMRLSKIPFADLVPPESLSTKFSSGEEVF